MHGLVRWPKGDDSQRLRKDQKQSDGGKENAEACHELSAASLRLRLVSLWELSGQAEGEQQRACGENEVSSGDEIGRSLAGYIVCPVSHGKTNDSVDGHCKRAEKNGGPEKQVHALLLW